MQDALNTHVTPGDIIAYPKGVYGNMGVGRVSKLTTKGLAYHNLFKTEAKTEYFYGSEWFTVVSKNHHDRTLSEVREALLQHRQKPKQAQSPYDMLHNQLVPGDIVAFATRHFAMVRLGQLVTYSDQLIERNKPYNLRCWVRLLGSQQQKMLNSTEMVLVTHDYNQVNPALVDDLLVPDYA